MEKGIFDFVHRVHMDLLNYEYDLTTFEFRDEYIIRTEELIKSLSLIVKEEERKVKRKSVLSTVTKE